VTFLDEKAFKVGLLPSTKFSSGCEGVLLQEMGKVFHQESKLSKATEGLRTKTVTSLLYYGWLEEDKKMS